MGEGNNKRGMDSLTHTTSDLTATHHSQRVLYQKQ